MKRVAVIGAGPSGLAALRSLNKYKEKIKFVGFERSNRVGGTWIHNDPFKPTSMYDNLTTNLPKEAMAFPGSPFPVELEHSFLGHKEVLDYLQRFAKQYDLLQNIKFRHKVEEVDPIAFSHTGSAVGWNIAVRDEKSNSNLVNHQVDSVIICNGHYSDPYIPDIEGIDTFPGCILHSHHYRSPKPFTHKTVLVLGAGPSGKDIAADLVSETDKIYLSHNNERVSYSTPDTVEEVVGISKVSGNRIRLLDEREVRVDVILMATGYRYTFPFLSKRCHPQISNEHIKYLHRFMVDISHPSLYYIGLNKDGLSFPQYHLQAEYAAACIAGTMRQLSQQEMMDEYNMLYKQLVTDKEREEMFFHHIDEHQWEYHEQLSSESQVENLDRGLEALYWHVVHRRENSFADFKKAVYRLNEDRGQFITLYEPDEVDMCKQPFQQENQTLV